MAIVFLFIASVTAEAGIVTFGLKGGLNYANIRIIPIAPDTPAFKTLQGLTGGVFLCLNLGPIGIQPEFLYARRGTKFDLTIDSVPYKAEYRLDYLEAILLLKWSVFPLGPVRPVIFAGPSYGSLSKARAVLFDTSGTEVESVDVKDMFKSSEFAAVFGGGLEFKLPFLKFSLEGRYHLGLSNIAETGMEVDFIKNKGYSMMLGISF
jgi:hypothetical protein